VGLEIFKSLIYGLQIGAVYILIALGLTVIFSMMNIMNFAHGEFYMLGAFSTLYANSLLHINYFIALIIGMIIVGCLGAVLERLLFRRLAGDAVGTTIVAIALMWILQAAAQLIFGKESRGMAEILSGTVTALHVNISRSRLLAMSSCTILVICLYFFMYKTKPGKAMQAVAQDRDAASLQGVDIDKINALGFGVGCALAGAAGGLMAPIFIVEATMGPDALIKSLSIIILGGLGSIPGAVIGGLILGVAESYGITYLGYPAATFPFIIILLVLIFKRTGLMGMPQ